MNAIEFAVGVLCAAAYALFVHYILALSAEWAIAGYAMFLIGYIVGKRRKDR